MKKMMIVCIALLAMIACNSGSNENKTENKNEVKEEKKEEVVDITKNPDYQKGLELVSKSDCFTCHKIDEKNIGPAWRDVAAKYAGQDTAVKYLAHKIINGGSGVWGQVPMAAHPTLSQEDAESVAKYVLLLKK